MTALTIMTGSGNNSLWIKWLEDEKADVSERYAQNLNKAQRALRAHPVDLINPDDLYTVKFFGPAIIKKIKDRARVERTHSHMPATAPDKRQKKAVPRRKRLEIPETDDGNPLLAGLYEPTYLPAQHVMNNNDNAPRIHQPEEYLRAAPDSFAFTYCDQAQKPVPHQGEAAVEVHEQQGILLYAILFRLPHVPLAYASGIHRIEPARSEQYADTPQTYYGLLPETNELATRIQSYVLPPLKARNRTTDPMRSLPAHANNFNVIKRTASTSSAAPAPVTLSLSRVPSFPVNSTRLEDDDDTTKDLFSPSLSLQFQRSPPPVPIATSTPLIKWPARTYDIICLIDTREVKDAKSRDYISDELRIRGVQVERRPLQLGDALWIGRRKAAYRQENDPQSEEVVLDFIVERKRLDDLVSSIKDGRFHEQKFRLKKSGLGKVFFVIETAGKDRSKDVRPYEDAVNTAISSTQVVDEFFVHQTADAKGTVELLKILHDAVCDKYKTEDIHIIPHTSIHRDNYNTLQAALTAKHPYTAILTFYESFNLLNAKTTFQTARECFARQLLCIKGMSAERVSFVVERYGTLRGLWEAWRDAEIQEERGYRREAEEATANGRKGKGRSKVVKAESMLAELGKGRRRVGKELSKKVYHFFMDDVYGDSDGENAED